MLGILLIDKPLGITSHDVVNTVRRRFGTRRVGHAGTLDPLGTGLLVVAVGPATRFLQYLPLEPKEYDAHVTFGRATNTQDAEGEIVSEAPVPEELEQRLVEVLPNFVGAIRQLPPMFSAVKKAGKPLYVYARKGEEVERATREVYIEAIDLLEVVGEVAHLRVVCSGGTYIRTLAHDVGEAVGCGAFLSSLNRTGVGRFKLEGAVKLDDAGPEHLLPLREALDPMPVIELDSHRVAHVREGRQVGIRPSPAEPRVAVATPDGDVFGIAKVFGPLLQPEVVIPSEVAAP
ncbi:MAG: tRNA pseudouridine(55) synthase TruB [Fimbriimonadaceae bacterium]|nr:tRNA pseudouridine(55) synthase TruB [Fimbriimonadaceae bacterium]